MQREVSAAHFGFDGSPARDVMSGLRDIPANIIVGLIAPPVAAILTGVLWQRTGWPAPRAAIVGVLVCVGGLAIDWPNLRRKPFRLIPLALITALVVLFFVWVAPDL
jgi:hypothetical protein